MNCKAQINPVIFSGCNAPYWGGCRELHDKSGPGMRATAEQAAWLQVDAVPGLHERQGLERVGRRAQETSLHVGEQSQWNWTAVPGAELQASWTGKERLAEKKGAGASVQRQEKREETWERQAENTYHSRCVRLKPITRPQSKCSW